MRCCCGVAACTRRAAVLGVAAARAACARGQYHTKPSPATNSPRRSTRTASGTSSQTPAAPAPTATTAAPGASRCSPPAAASPPARSAAAASAVGSTAASAAASVQRPAAARARLGCSRTEIPIRPRMWCWLGSRRSRWARAVRGCCSLGVHVYAWGVDAPVSWPNCPAFAAGPRHCMQVTNRAAAHAPNPAPPARCR